MSILPVVMEGTVKKGEFAEVRAKGDMIIYFLFRECEEEALQEPKAKLIRMMTPGEKEAVSSWLNDIAGRPFVAICEGEYLKLIHLWSSYA